MKLAIVKLSALGDIVHAMVALQFIKAARPDARIDWLVEERFAGLLADNPDIERIRTVNLKALKSGKTGLFREICKIRTYAAENYDLVIDAQGLIKSALVSRLLSSRNAGFDRRSIREKAAAFVYAQTVAFPFDANSIERNVAVLTQPLGVNVQSEQIFQKRPFLFYRTPEQSLQSFFKSNKANVIFVIGSTWPSRNYPKEKYLKVIAGMDCNSLIVWGNDQEHESADWIAERSQATVLPRLDLNDLKAVIAQADLLIGNDTGPTHMAWGLNRPSITLFGPTPVSRVCQTGINRVLKSPSIVNPFKLDKNDFSIAEIPESEVIAMARLLL